MKSLLFKSILLVSHREKRAKRVTFGPGINTVKGENDTGKSSLIKSLYYALGAEPHNVHSRWKGADVIVLLRFELDGVEYAIYRQRKSFSLFDKDDSLIGTYNKVTSELGPVLAKLFSFNLKLNDNTGKTVTPPPAYLFLPFYIDQDKGWTATWSSFERLGQLPRWKKPVVNYHMGLRPDQWYALDAKRKWAEDQKDEPMRQIASIKKIIDRTHETLARVDFDVDIDQFKAEVDLLIVECDKLKAKETQYREKMTHLRTEKIRLEAQIEIVMKTHDELSADYKYAVETSGNSVDCPTCGAGYENSFAERFAIAEDAETCDDLLKSLKDDLVKIDHLIRDVEQSLTKSSVERQTINELLESKQGTVVLRDLVELEGKKALLTHLRGEYEELSKLVTKLVIEVDRLQEEMKKYDNRQRRREILDNYEASLRKNATTLNVLSLDEAVYRKPDATIKESGSDMPRAILGCTFSALTAISENGNATFCPIVIDAPNQQEQDKENLEVILKFIRSNRPSSRQMIIGLVDDAGIDFGGEVIELTTKQFLLEEKDYLSLASELNPFTALNLGLSTTI